MQMSTSTIVDGERHIRTVEHLPALKTNEQSTRALDSGIYTEFEKASHRRRHTE